jgi:hypothetical protein
MNTWTLDEQGSIAWIAHPDERAQRASVALAVPGGCLVCDPVDAPGLDAALAGVGPVLGVSRLLGRHGRDSEAIAARHAAPIVAADELASNAAFAGIEARSLPGGEWALWLAERRLLVIPETVGAVPGFVARRGDLLGLHPVARIRPPRIQLAPINPDTLAVGHG